jgi:hypothetical protein
LDERVDRADGVRAAVQHDAALPDAVSLSDHLGTLRATWIPLAFVVGCVSKDTPAPAPSTSPAPPLPTLVARHDGSIAIQARRWTDVVTADPDPVEQEITLGKQVSWSSLSRSLALTEHERDALVAAAALSAAPPAEPSRAFEGRYVTVSIRLPTGAPATVEMLRILDAARTRYIASRMPEARTMTLELHGHWRGGSKDWEPWQLTVSPDGTMHEREQSTQLDDADRVAVLDWASRLPERRMQPTREHTSDPPPRGIDPFTLTGTFTIGATSRPVAVELGPAPVMEGAYSPVEMALYNVWNINRGPD